MSLLASDLVIANNTDQYGFAAQNWDSNLKLKPLPELDPDGLLFNFLFVDRARSKYDFIAQTVTASSYGLMQLMYFVAIEDLIFVASDGVGIDPTNNVVGLFNPEVNIALGSKHLYAKYIIANEPSARSQVNSVHQFLVMLRRAAQVYNGLPKARTKSDDTILGMEYNSKIWANAKKYFPI